MLGAAPAGVTEPDVALTDWGLALEAAVFAILLARRGPPVREWCLFFGATAVAALLGGLVHGFFLDPGARAGPVLWRLALGAVGLAAYAAWRLGAALLFSPRTARLAGRLAALEYAAYLAVLVAVSDRYQVAVAQYLPAAAFLLVALAREGRRRRPGAGAGAAGLVLTGVAGAGREAGWALPGLGLSPNALYHVLQAVALAGLFLAARSWPAPARAR
jgi:hypothetical protein